MRVIGYVRVSTDEQGISLEAQTEKLRAFCDLHGLDLVAIEKEALVGVIVLVAAPGKLVGGDLLDAVRPALSAVTAAFPKARVPETLAQQITDGIAAAVNQYYRR